MKTVMLSFFLLTAGWMHAEEAAIAKPIPVSTVVKTPGLTMWRTSVAALVAAHSMDIHSSWGKHELNPALSGPGGKFGREGALLKIAFTGGLLGVEYLVTRKYPNAKLHRALSIINFGAAGVVGGVAMRNYSIPRPR